ncbi:hypothetical protein [Foetidibacter luteolus]|uniref:hypothetical protein n=1 Tax=Foetidibacter luteolus TaxID=2608880 RepID=UPI00129A9C70|nr:hypothetical protein [Foetidibacter luteolus]
MIKFNEIKIGDYVIGEYEGQKWEGEVTRLNGDEKQVCVETDVQEFWFEPEHLYPIPLSDESLQALNFTREEFPDGSVKYKKGSFRISIDKKDDFSSVELWYREDRRHHPDVHYVHQLQNHYLQMTKIHLTKEVLA